MTFADLVPGDILFVDANIFVYHFAPDPILQIPCSQLLQRIENREIQAFTSTHVLAELASDDRDFDRVPGITRYAPG